MKPALNLRVSQHLALTPQLQQSIRLLQLSTLELAQEIEQMLQDNPFLERDELELSDAERATLEREQRSDELLRQEDMESAQDALFLARAAPPVDAQGSGASESASVGAGESASEQEALPTTEPDDWDGDGSLDIAADDADWGVEAGARGAAAQDNEDFDPMQNRSSAGRLQDHLHQQALSLRLSEEDRAALGILIESLNDDGYLEDDFETLALGLGATSVEEMEAVIARFSLALPLLQSMEPSGVGARNLAECLALQLRQHSAWAHDQVLQTAALIVQQPLALLAKRDVKRLAQLCHASADSVKNAMAVIARLEPKPARRFAQVERNIIIPDVIVREVQRRGQTSFVAQLNADVLPRLYVHTEYAHALKREAKSPAIIGLQNQVQEARWFIKNVQQRFDTILRVSQAIVERQSSFFRHGAVAMRPLVLREIADEVGLHESTVSRATSGKFMSTPRGTFELKHFFGSGLTTDTGGTASSTAVRELIKQFIDAENSAKPLSDSALATLLKEQGIDCARRTVAKYREAMRIPVASLRKNL